MNDLLPYNQLGGVGVVPLMKQNKDLGTFMNQDELIFFPATRNTALDSRGGTERQYKPIGSLIAPFYQRLLADRQGSPLFKKLLLFHRSTTITR